MTAQQPDPGAGSAPAPVCYRHPGRETWVTCTRCERPICPDCMRPASVGFQCPECVNEGAKTVRQARTVFGGSTDGEAGLVTKVLMGLNVGVFVVMVLIELARGQAAGAMRAITGGGTKLHELFASYARLDFNDGTSITAGVADGEVYRLITAGFLHYGVLHLLLNMWVLSMFGKEVERLVGRWRFLAVYLLSGVGGCVLALILAPDGWLAGASGSVFGLFGAMLVFLRKLKLDPRQIVLLIVLNFAFGFFVTGSGFAVVSWQGHLGGLITGVLTAGVLAYAPSGPRRTAIQAAGLTIVGLSLAGLAVLAVT